jgi:hypothetical protein
VVTEVFADGGGALGVVALGAGVDAFTGLGTVVEFVAARALPEGEPAAEGEALVVVLGFTGGLFGGAELVAAGALAGRLVGAEVVGGVVVASFGGHRSALRCAQLPGHSGVQPGAGLLA